MSVLSASEQWHWRNVFLNKVRGMRAVCVLLYDEYLSFGLCVSVKSVCIHVNVGTWCVHMCVCVPVGKVVETRLGLDWDPEVTGREF